MRDPRGERGIVAEKQRCTRHETTQDSIVSISRDHGSRV